MENSEILNYKFCQNPDLLWGLPVVAGSKAQEERDGGRLSAGGEIPVIADGDREQERKVWALSAGREEPTAVA